MISPALRHDGCAPFPPKAACPSPLGRVSGTPSGRAPLIPCVWNEPPRSRTCRWPRPRRYRSIDLPSGPRLITRVGPTVDSSPQLSWMWPHRAMVGRASSIARSTASLPRCVPRLRSTWPFGGEWTTSTAPSGQPDSIAVASSSSRSKLQSHGVTGTPAPSPKKARPSISVGSPCRTVAVSHPEHAARSAASVSLLPGTSTVGASIASSASTVGSGPSWTEARSPAQTTTSTSLAASTSRAAASRSVWASLKARSLNLGAEYVRLGVGSGAPTTNKGARDERAVPGAVLRHLPGAAAQPAVHVLSHLRGDSDRDRAQPRDGVLVELHGGRRHDDLHRRRRRVPVPAPAADDPVPQEVPAVVVRLEPGAAAVHEQGRDLRRADGRSVPVHGRAP